jgi:hypothetical protein
VPGLPGAVRAGGAEPTLTEDKVGNKLEGLRGAGFGEILPGAVSVSPFGMDSGRSCSRSGRCGKLTVTVGGLGLLDNLW